MSLSVNEFKKILAEQLEEIEAEYGYERNSGNSFELWCARLLKKIDPSLEPDSPEESMTFGKDDLKADLVFEDADRKYSLIVQCKYVGSKKHVREEEVSDFFGRHMHFMDTDWVKNYGSQQTVELLKDYKDKIKEGWKIELSFLTNATDTTQRILDLVETKNTEYLNENKNVECSLHDFSGLKELHARSLSIEETIPAVVDFDLADKNFFTRENPHKTMIASVKGNTIRALYRKYKYSLFSYNVRAYLGDRNINKDIRKTAEDNPENFFYFNNGISAICTNFNVDENNKVRAENFQIINGAQTAGAIYYAKANDSVRVLFRLTKTKTVKSDSGINTQIIRYNNTQNSIKISDFRANDHIQKWLQLRFENEKHLEALGRYVYKRKRGDKNASLGRKSITLEEFAKIRYTIINGPTLAISSPKQLWIFKNNGGAYEDAFGVSGVLEDQWSDDVFYEALVAILFFRKIQDKTKELSKHKRYKQTGRMKYFVLGLASLYIEKKLERTQHKKFLSNEKFCAETFENFWRHAKPQILMAHDRAEDIQLTVFAYVRNEKEFIKVKDRFEVVLDEG